MIDPVPDLSAWPFRPISIERSHWGLNNESWFVHAADGEYVCRVYSDADETSIRSEHALLRDPALRDLPFSIPRPLVTRGGDTVGRVDLAGRPRYAAVFERCRGTHLDDDDVDGVEKAGRAFAMLDQALVNVSLERRQFDGALSSISSDTRDLGSLTELGEAGLEFVATMSGDATRLRGTLAPRQLIHGDFAFGNILTDAGRITAVLDFEFAAIDARAAELATALRLVLSKGTRDQLWRALLRGYLSVLPLEPWELDALPLLVLHHEAVVLVWSVGRARRGYQSRLEGNVRRALALREWMERYGAELVREARALTGRSDE